MAHAIKSCTCTNSFQDEKYGKGMRVHTVMSEDNRRKTGTGYTCTVCGKTRS